ncbi:glycosyltransferase family 4 protein [Altererythrobacter sp. ZODW24]|uniref:glycosyltransferase family 4 protein n=1 Tax=Altererythrobacter sp. ZODW24 TaxID=2185142 RepID=UPI0013B42125|nr:glycosyltransferase family 4 protein [Altererythrobacter sp. ZODW24]
MFVTRKWAPAMGGMETYCHRLTEELANDYELDVVALPGRDDGSPPSTSALIAFPLTVLRRWFDRDTAPDILHIADMALWPIGLLAPRKTALVISAHGTDVSYPRRGGIKGILYGAYLRLGARLLRRVKAIANSAATEAALYEYGWRNTAIVALATDIVADAPKDAPTKSILFAGRLVKRKGLRWFTENVLNRLSQDITLDVAGTRWDPDENAALSHPRVNFIGRLGSDDLKVAYASALAVVLPNIELPNGEFEGFGLIASEASAAGGVTLAANCGGLSEAVIEGKTGFLIESGNADAWIKQITEVAEWPLADRQKFTARAMKSAREHYSWSRVARETATHYSGD